MELVSELPISPTESLNTFRCGHSFIQSILEINVPSFPDESDESVTRAIPTSCNGAMAVRDYQMDGIDFIENPNGTLDRLNTSRIGQNIPFNCLIADQMGLGKTIQSLIALRNSYATKTPALILVKSSTVWQWIKEYKIWCDPTPLGIFLIEGSKSWIPPGFKTYIVSMDTFGRIISKENERQKLMDFGFKLLIVDEIHSFKNPSSQRTQSLIQFIKDISHREIEREAKFSCAMCGKEWCETIKIEIDLSSTTQIANSRHYTHCPQCGAAKSEATQKAIADEREKEERMGLIFLSGTPIKNRAEEFFIPLNILAPEKFPSLERFRRRFLIQADNGKWKSVHPYRLEEFRETIAPYVLRRERKDVLKDLPKFSRTFTTVTIEDENMKAAYNREIDKIKEKDSTKEVTQSDIQENIFVMRRIIGMAKVKHAAQLIRDFLDESEDELIAVGVHHHSVRDLLEFELNKDNNPLYRPVVINAGKDIQWNIDKWKKGHPSRCGIISQLGGGVGLNLQFCHILLNVERQWNSADEEQLEDRFNRIGQEYPVSAEYLVARGTIDVWFSNMVEEKRIVSGETYGVNFDPMESKQTMREMIEWAMVNKL